VSDYKVVNPATNEIEREFDSATDAEVQDIMERSYRAYQSWRTTGKDERTKVLQRVAELYKERIDDLAALITREMGKPTREAKGEIQLVISIYRYYADQGPELLKDDRLLGEREAAAAVLFRDGQANQAELRAHLVPDGPVDAVLGLHELANPGQRRLVDEEAPNRGAQFVLFRGHTKCHLTYSVPDEPSGSVITRTSSAST